MFPHDCAIDNGYGDTKAKDDKLMFKIKSRAQTTTEDGISDTSIIEFEGQKYKIGTGQDDIDLRKTGKQVHKICTLAALGRMLGDDKEKEFRVILSQPLMQYRNKELREEFRSYIAKPEVQKIKVAGSEKKIIIRDSAVFPQGGAALYYDLRRTEEYKRTLNAVIDWGSITINGFIADGLNPIPETMLTENLGISILHSRIRTTLNERLGLNIQDYEMPYLLGNTPKQMESIVREEQDIHFDTILNRLAKKNWSLSTLNMIGVGGGFLVTRDIVKRYFPRLEILQNPVYANVIGMYNVGKKVWSNGKT